MSAYYNEIDPYAAAWLRKLISAGHIAPGDVDERSIEDVRPDELRGYTQCHFFAGIGVWSHALRRAGWSDDRPVWTGSCPCQPFSAAGKGGGFADERHLWPAFHHLIRECGPRVVFGEQVASKDGLAWLDLVQTDLEGTAYASGAVDLCAAGVGAPHIRQRLWWFARRGVGQADACGSGLEGQDGRAVGHECEAAERGGGPLGLEHRPSDRRIERRPEPSRRGTAGGCGDGGMGHTEHLGSGRDAGASAGAQGGPFLRPVGNGAGSSGAVRGLAHADGRHTSAERQQPGWEQRQQQEDGRALQHGRPGPTNGLWRDADWLFCRDGKWRPVEPGTFPLAHGAASRVGRLRAYGNAIVAQAAEEFIGAYLDAESAVA